MVSVSIGRVCPCACNPSQVHASPLVSTSRYCLSPYPTVARSRRPPPSSLQHCQGKTRTTTPLLWRCRSAGLEECGVRHLFGGEEERQQECDEVISSSGPLSFTPHSYSGGRRCQGEGHHRESGVASECCSSQGALRDAGAGHRDAPSAGFGRPQEQQKWGRRLLAGVLATWIVLLGGLYNSGPAFADSGGGDATPAADGGESLGSSGAATASTKAGLIERLLERSKANKSKYDQERLDNFYKRNYKDYFDFLKGSIINKDKDTLTENELGILRWLEKNK